MQSSNYFDTDKLEAVLVWREFRMPWVRIWLIVLATFALFTVIFFLENREPAHYLPRSLAAAVSFLAVLVLLKYLGRLFADRFCVVINDSQFAGPDDSLFQVFAHPIKGEWSQIHTIAHVHSLVGISLRPIENNLLLFGKAGRARLSLPPLNDLERTQFFEILTRIAQNQDIELVFDHTEEGNKRVQELPWI